MGHWTFCFHIHTAFYLLHIPELILNFRTITSIIWIAPSNHGSIGQDRGKRATCGLNLLHILKLILNWRTVSTTVWIPHVSILLPLRHHPANAPLDAVSSTRCTTAVGYFPSSTPAKCPQGLSANAHPEWRVPRSPVQEEEVRNDNWVGGFNPSEKYESQLGWLFSVYEKHVPNHQPDNVTCNFYTLSVLVATSWAKNGRDWICPGQVLRDTGLYLHPLTL